MIIVKIQGGLGNQMFQYAMARSVAIKNNVEFKLDLTWFDNHGSNTERIFGLNNFNILKNIASNEEAFRMKRMRVFLGRDLYNALIPFRCKKYVKTKDFRPFDKKYLFVNKNVYLEGYWSDERFFVNITSIIREEFTLRAELSQKNQLIADNLKKTNDSVSIHIRRGDYIVNDATHKIFNVCGVEYYSRAINQIRSRVKNPFFYVFSDDIDWVMKNLNIGSDSFYVSESGQGLPYEELILMSMCSHNIIANSTFSWWGAWLNPNNEKIIIAPDRWYNLDSFRGDECLPPSWFKIPVI